MAVPDLPLVESAAHLRTVVLAFVVRCGVAALCGGMIGVERELRAKPAGLRTNLLICVGAAMYMLVGLMLVHGEGEAGTDPTRIAAQVVTGIGFLGAGLTSAATIWVVAAIGIVAGAGFPITAMIATTMVVLTLVVLGKVESHLLNRTNPDDNVRTERRRPARE